MSEHLSLDKFTTLSYEDDDYVFMNNSQKSSA
jgi:hypothetical protein